MSRQNSDDGLLNSKEAAEWLGISERTLFSLKKEEEIGHVRIGRRVAFTRQQLRDYIERHSFPGENN